MANRSSSFPVECPLKLISNKHRIPHIHRNHRRSFWPCFVVKQPMCCTWTIRLSISMWYPSRLISLVCAMLFLPGKYSFVFRRSPGSIGDCCSARKRSCSDRFKEWQVELLERVFPDDHRAFFSYPLFESLHTIDLHESPITFCDYLTEPNMNFYQNLLRLQSKQTPKRTYSQQVCQLSLNILADQLLHLSIQGKSYLRWSIRLHYFRLQRTYYHRVIDCPDWKFSI